VSDTKLVANPATATAEAAGIVMGTTLALEASVAALLEAVLLLIAIPLGGIAELLLGVAAAGAEANALDTPGANGGTMAALLLVLDPLALAVANATAVVDEDDSADGSAEAETGVAGTLLAALGKVPDAAPAGGIDDDNGAE